MQVLWDTLCIYECRISSAQRIELHIERSKIEVGVYRSVVMLSRSMMEVLIKSSKLEDLVIQSLGLVCTRYYCEYKHISINFITNG